MASYDAAKVEAKWREKWDKTKIYKTDLNKPGKKYYNLTMFPYPSGNKLHIGHWYNYGPADSWGRFMRMRGYNVFQPMGFDAFGLPAENFAIETGIHPRKSTEKNVAYMIKQLKRIGCMYDWDKMVNTSEPQYYKWTQWLFLQMYKNGLAVRKNGTVNYCPSCKTVLANEQVWEGACERCKSEVKQKQLEQWFWQTTKYAQKLLDNLEGLDWPKKTKLMQTNWIGRSEGITYKQRVKGMDIEFEAYDSVPQTFMAQTFAVIAPEHRLLPQMVKGTKYEKDVMKFVAKIRRKKITNKFDIAKDMEGVFTGRYVENPFGTGDLPIWAASFVVADYGSGIVNCSAHDERDFAFAKKYGIKLRPVMFPADEKEAKRVKNLEYCYHHAPDGVLAEPVKFKGRKWGEVREEMLDYIESKGFGRRDTQYKLRDWLISRQRYWGAPIPIVYCEKCGTVPVDEKDLPVILPDNVKYLPGGKLSPLATSSKFVNVKCPKCRGKAKRDVETMDTFVCSSWYFLRYLDAHNKRGAWDKKSVKSWMPVDMYVGGPEHACMHLIYARFVMMALKDFGLAPCEEPFKRLVHQGLVTKDGAKMSKSRGNVVSPDEFVEKYGSDVFRMYLMFMGPFEDGGAWNDKGITGVARFVERFFGVIVAPSSKIKNRDELERRVNKLVKKFSGDIEQFHFNTAIATMMEFVNFARENGIDVAGKRTIARLIAPLAPHLGEECWELLGGKYSVFDAGWPKFDARMAREDRIRIGVQVNGKVRGDIEVAKNAPAAEALALARAHENVGKYLAEGKIVKEIYVPGRIVGFVVK